MDGQSRDKVPSEVVDSEGNRKASHSLLLHNLRLYQVWTQWGTQSGADSTRQSIKISLSVPPWHYQVQYGSKAMETHISYLCKIKYDKQRHHPSWALTAKQGISGSYWVSQTRVQCHDLNSSLEH